MEPRIFKFGTPYAEMYNSMSATPEDTGKSDQSHISFRRCSIQRQDGEAL